MNVTVAGRNELLTAPNIKKQAEFLAGRLIAAPSLKNPARRIEAQEDVIHGMMFAYSITLSELCKVNGFGAKFAVLFLDKAYEYYKHHESAIKTYSDSTYAVKFLRYINFYNEDV